MKTVKRIDKLTPKQEAAMAGHRDKWIEIGLKTGPADFKTFDKNIAICYEKAGVPMPKRIVRVKSPLVGGLAASVANAIWNKRRADGKDGAVDSAVGSAVRSAVATARDIAKKAGVKLDWHYWFGGQFWVGYGYYGWYGVATVAFLMDICKLKLAKDIMERAEAYRKVSESVSHFWTNSEFVMVCDRPVAINRNAEGRLHSTTGMAIEYGDGWGLHYIHGVKFTPEQFENTKNLTFKEIISWEDVDQRAALLRDRPLDAMIEESGAKLIDETDECCGYKLYEMDLGLRSKVKAMVYKGWSHFGEGRQKTYAKWVKPTATNCLEEIASLRGLTVEEFRNAVKS